jgi:GTPase SAR1 family protein
MLTIFLLNLCIIFIFSFKKKSTNNKILKMSGKTLFNSQRQHRSKIKNYHVRRWRCWKKSTHFILFKRKISRWSTFQPSKLKKYDPTIENSYVIKTKINDITYSVSLVDTAGQDEFRGFQKKIFKTKALMSSWIKDSDCFFLIFF